jgi:hypothetical protein
MNLTDGRAYYLPDGYEVTEAALTDVRRCLSPTFTRPETIALDRESTLSRDVHGVAFLPGFVGLNDLGGGSDDLSACVQVLAHVTPLRDFLLADPLLLCGPREAAAAAAYQQKYALLRSMSEVVRRMWSRGNFKSVVSPSELLRVVAAASGRKGSRRVEVAELLSWLLNELHRCVGRFARDARSDLPLAAAAGFADAVRADIVHHTFQVRFALLCARGCSSVFVCLSVVCLCVAGFGGGAVSDSGRRRGRVSILCTL